MRFYLCQAQGFSRDGYKESYMAAIENAYSEIEEGLEEWLDENMPNRYFIDNVNIPDIACIISLYVVFQNEIDATAFKLRWE